MNEERNGKMMIPLDILLPDPLNEEAFDEGDLLMLAEDIKRGGFIGEISAYPIENGFYQIESGHRRCKAARMAGLSEVAVNITDPPGSLLERRVRLARWNLHNRPATPMGLAKLTQFLFHTYELENEERKKQGLPTEPVLEKIAADLECSTGNVSRYRSLLRLSQKLQDLVADGTCPWSPMSGAAALSDEQQDMLYTRIMGRVKLLEPITSSWLEEEIREFKYVIPVSCTVHEYRYDRTDLSMYSDELRSRINGTKRSEKRSAGTHVRDIRKAKQLLMSLSGTKLSIRKQDLEEVREALREISDLAEEIRSSL